MKTLNWNNQREMIYFRRCSSWIPASATAQILSSMSATHSPSNSSGTSSPSNFYPDRASLTAPAVVIREELADPVRNFVAHYAGRKNVL